MLKDSLEVRGQRGFFIQEQEATERAGEQQQAGSFFRDIQMRSQMKNHLDFLFFSVSFSPLLPALIANMKYRGRRKVRAAAALQQQQRDITNICPRPETVVERDDVIKGRRRGPELVGGPSALLGEQERKNLLKSGKASSLHFLILASSKYLWPHVCTAQGHRAGDEGKKGLSWQQLDRRGPPDQRGRRSRWSCRSFKGLGWLRKEGDTGISAILFLLHTCRCAFQWWEGCGGKRSQCISRHQSYTQLRTTQLDQHANLRCFCVHWYSFAVSVQPGNTITQLERLMKWNKPFSPEDGK